MGWHEVGPATTLIPCSGHTWPSYTWPSSSSLVAEALLSPLPASSPFCHLLLLIPASTGVNCSVPFPFRQGVARSQKW
jgi:hypothetical protein